MWVARSSTDSVSEDEAASVQAKSLLAHIASEVRARREVSGDEAYLIALDAYRFLQRGLLRLGPGQVELPCIAGRGSHMRRARRIYHSPEAVDQYLKTFDRLLVLRHFGLPKKLMVQVTGHSLSLIEEHLAIADKHFPTTEALTQYLTSRRVDLEEAG